MNSSLNDTSIDSLRVGFFKNQVDHFLTTLKYYFFSNIVYFSSQNIKISLQNNFHAYQAFFLIAKYKVEVHVPYRVPFEMTKAAIYIFFLMITYQPMYFHTSVTNFGVRV
jgi:hypothetical protein